MTARPYAVVTGGGTGGHVSPALAVGEALVRAGHPRSSVVFAGGRRGIEGRLVPEAGFALHRLPGRGIKRQLSADNLSSALGLGAAVVMAFGLALRERPRVVVSVGGYAGLAYGLAAVALRIPLVVVNVDAVPGAVNRLLGRFAAANAVALPGTPLPGATVTGAPVRDAVLAVRRSPEQSEAVRARLGTGRGRRLVVVTGGSLGAGSLNAAALELADRWRERADLALYHLAGERNLESVTEEAETRGLLEPGRGLEYRLAGFDPALVEALAACDVAVCRAGASTVAELTAVGVPSVLVPLPGAPGDHQTRNAEALANAGAAVLLADRELTGDRLGEVLERLVDKPGQLEEMGEAARSLGHREAAAEVARMAQAAADARTSRRKR